ncbi:MAG: arsenosugar biosynthesis arsenite methyltransferase ArsM [Acidobacteriota bacterium]|jgi:SAM-dependent methyltransferase
MSREYLMTAREVYRKAALTPEVGLCCTTSPVWSLPGLEIPGPMLQMNYGCGSTVHPRDLSGSPTILYVGVGGGMELLQFSYFSRRPGAVWGVDPVPEMLDSCRRNLNSAEQLNPWFRAEFVELREGDALTLPVKSESVDVAAQNCLFNILQEDDLRQALGEIYRVLRPRGRLVLSDPICEQPIPERLRSDEHLRALCLSGALPLDDYLEALAGVGFGTMEVRARRPYRVLDPLHFSTPQVIFVESVEVCAIKDPMPADGPCVFTGRTAIYFGDEEQFSDGAGHTLKRHQPLAICDKTAGKLGALGREDLWISDSTWFYDGGGCC